MLRLVLLSDTHGAKIRNPIPDGDVLIHAGDFSKLGTEDELSEFCQFLLDLPHRHKVFIAGNHDLLFEEKPDVARSLVSAGHYLLDQSITIEGVRIYGAPWTPRFYSWAFMKDRGAEMAAVWSRVPDGIDVLVTHGPPQGMRDYVPSSKEHVGCEALLPVVARVQPKIHIFGHIHEGYGTETKTWDNGSETVFANASICNNKYEGVNPPLVVDFDRETRLARVVP